MAEVQGRLTGEPGVCLGTLGPGAANLVTGVANANMDRAPLIAITGQAGTERWHKESHQAMDVVGMFGPITKWASSIIRPQNVPEIVHKAFKIATTEKPGACHIELPEDIAVSRPPRAVPSAESVDHAWNCILSARSPVILAGNGAARKDTSDELERFVAATGIGVWSRARAVHAERSAPLRVVWLAHWWTEDEWTVALLHLPGRGCHGNTSTDLRCKA